MDNDLLDIYCNADKITPAGVRALAAVMQRQRDLIRRTVFTVHDQCAIHLGAGPTMNQYEDAFKAIDVQINELENEFEIGNKIRWEDLTRHGV